MSLPIEKIYSLSRKAPIESSVPAMINRDLSLLEFFRRVLEEALDETQPLLERVKFLSIFSSNLDEFFMIRVSGLKEKLGHKLDDISLDGYTRKELLAEIRRRVLEMIEVQTKCLVEDVFPLLAQNGIKITCHKELAQPERKQLDDHFIANIYPLLTPQAVDPTHPFPYISGSSLNLCLSVKPDLNRRVARAFKHIGYEFFVRIKVPPFVPRLIPVGDDDGKFILVEDLIAANVRQLIPEACPESCHLFRITRDADMDLREAEAQDLLETMEENLKQRRFGDVVRLEVSKSMPDRMVEYLCSSLEIAPEDIYLIDGPINIADLAGLMKLDRPDLKDIPIRVTYPSGLNESGATFDLIKARDLLLHHPYMPYSIITDFIKEAVADPDVLAIKMCLYRIGPDSPIAPLLIKASESGKQVTVLIEIKARFDEANNIEWARRLEQSGVHVIYGLLGLKTHCKTTLIVRREDDELRRYVHLATGNYNPETSAFYTDLGLLTADSDIGADATELFNYLTVYSQRKSFKKLMVAPINLRQKIIELIGRETAHARNYRPARIVAKLNRLADGEIVHALYEASRHGVKIDLIVRGICTLRPGVSSMSENIRVRSIVGRLLEHSRLYYFENGGDEEMYTGSSDWMPRNLDRRVEVLAPIRDKKIKEYLRDKFLAAYLSDNVKARELLPDGDYRRIERSPDEVPFDSQASFQGHLNVVDFDTHHGNSKSARGK